MELINRNELTNFMPDIALAEAKGLATNGILDDNYFYLETLYGSLLNQYISYRLKLSNIEKQLDSINCRAVEDKDLYQSLSDNKYFYVRNNMYVEHLSKKQIDYLLSQSEKTINDELMFLIEATYRDVIKTYNFDIDHFDISYGPIGTPYNKPNDNLVMGIRFAEEDDSLYPDEDSWFEDYGNRKEALYNMIPELEERWGSILGTDVSIIEYDENSVILSEQNKTATL